ncbi:MAG: translation initiation factor IF-3 [Gammaproteobacteria bacterium]|nr:translation initiation factor IF-3 [Gammaproteobacteria bacterium]MYK43618.1 translation initiation factor IF-3 [Gammaproteobacteria bacterium]
MSKAAASSKLDRALLNENIEAPRVRLIDKEGEQVGVVPRSQALAAARAEGLDLVLIAPQSQPPVVKILDYSKHLFEQKKAWSANRKKQRNTQVKEIRFRATTDESDYAIKLKRIIGFLEDGDKAKVSLRFKGRESLHPEIGLKMLNRLEKDLQDAATVELVPKLEGQQMTMIFAPLSRKKK